MPSARHLAGVVLKNGAPIFLARVVGNDGVAITQSSLSSSGNKYTISRLDPNDPDSRTAVTSHTDVALTVSSVIYNTLQRDALWQNDQGQYLDELGYNLKVQPSLVTAVPFAVAGAKYLMEITLVPSSGEKIIIPFEVSCI